ncbi:MAG: sulfurtransferase TusA [Gammaproteobacteria bacterium]|nr:sulfurtransferase TusA [Gammaproteobacteria bacterium]
MHATDHAIDAVGLECPEPLMILRNKVRGMAVGETVAVVATDPSTVRDFTNFCRFMGHELAESSQEGERYRFIIRKRAKAERR